MNTATSAIECTTVLCDHCSDAGNIGLFVSRNDGSRFLLCGDRMALKQRQGLYPAPEPPEPTSPASSRRPLPFRRAQLRRLGGGQIQVLSSDGKNVYDVTLCPPACTCPGFVNHGHCYHQRSARACNSGQAVA